MHNSATNLFLFKNLSFLFIAATTCSIATGIAAQEYPGLLHNLSTSEANPTLDAAATMPFGFSHTTARTTDSNSFLFAYRYPQVQLEVGNYPVAPKPLQLEQVHIYVRHGERTPVGVRLVGPPSNIPEHWKMCQTAHRFRSAVASLMKDQPDIPEFEEILRARKVVERKDGTAVVGDCLLGELTDLGRYSTFNFGKSLRHLYVERLSFLPDSLEEKETVYFRTTNMPRTTESLQQVIHGLYPPEKCHPSSIPPILVRNGKDENLIGNTYSCKRLELLQIGFAKAAAEAYNRTLEHLDKKVSKYLNGNPIRIDGRPRASGVLDTIRSAVAHGIKVPPEFEDKNIVDVIERAVVNEWFSDKTLEVRRLGMGRLFEDLAHKMQAKVERGDKDALKILVHSTHDTGIAAICQTLDVYDDKWPAFTASITFELFKDPEQTGPIIHPQAFLSRLSGKSTPRYYVRMRYQNKNIPLPMCADEGQHLPGHPEFCTLAAFQERLKQLIPEDWDAECQPSGRS